MSLKLKIKFEGKCVHIFNEKPESIHVYIAGPDFPHIDTYWIEELENRLKEQNFIPHRPIQENGLFTGNETEEEQQAIYEQDVKLLEQAGVLIAVILNDDPGTYVEIGWMSKSGKPVIIFDPQKQVQNLFLKKSADAVESTLNGVMERLSILSGVTTDN